MAFKIFIVAFCSALLTATFASSLGRVVGGIEAQKSNFLHQVSIRRDNVHICSGSILDENTILTAAHCLGTSFDKPYLAKSLTLRVGSLNQYAGGHIINVESVKIHENYGNFMNDIGLMKTVEPINLSEGQLETIDLPTEDIEAGTEVTFAGWGINESGGQASFKLQEVKMRAISPESCRIEINFGYQSILCLAHDTGRGSCEGDAGGGAIVNNKLVGINSFAIGKCGSQYPDGFSRVFYYVDWIKSNIQ